MIHTNISDKHALIHIRKLTDVKKSKPVWLNWIAMGVDDQITITNRYANKIFMFHLSYDSLPQNDDFHQEPPIRSHKKGRIMCGL
jgi:hypothetical protein